MTTIKNSFRFIAGGVLALFIVSGALTESAFAAGGKRLQDFSEEEVKELAAKANKELDSLKSLLNTYHSKVNSFKSKQYSYNYSEAEATKLARQSVAYSQGATNYGVNLQTLTENIMKQSHSKKYSDFISWSNGSMTKELSWTQEERVTASNPALNISLSADFSDTDLHWDKVAGKARKQAGIELNPQNGANKAVAMAEEIEDALRDVTRQHSEVKNLLAALNPANYVTKSCLAEVKEGEECPTDKTVYTVTNQSGTAQTGASKGCPPLPVKYAEIQTCVLCPLFTVILNTDQTIATKSFHALSGGFKNLILIVLALFVAYHTLMVVSAFTKQDTPKYLSTLMVQGFKVLVAALLLTDPSYIYNYVINPLMQAGLEFGLALMLKGDSTSDAFKGLAAAEQASMPSGVIGQNLLASVMAAIKLFNRTAAQMPAIGSSLVCISFHEARNILPDFSMFFEGVLVYGFGWLIVLAASFYLLDSVVRFGIFCALLPFLIASWPFKVTKQYANTGWKIFMNAFFNFVMMGLIIGLNSELISQGLTGGSGGIDELEAAINGSNVDDLKELMDISGSDFLVLVACCLFAFKLVGQINELASDIAGGGGGTAIGGKIGGLAAQAAKKTASVAGNVAGKSLGGLYEVSGAKAKVANVKDKVAGKIATLGMKKGSGGSSGGDKNNENKKDNNDENKKENNDENKQDNNNENENNNDSNNDTNENGDE